MTSIFVNKKRLKRVQRCQEFTFLEGMKAEPAHGVALQSHIISTYLRVLDCQLISAVPPRAGKYLYLN